MNSGRMPPFYQIKDDILYRASQPPSTGSTIPLM